MINAPLHARQPREWERRGATNAHQVLAMVNVIAGMDKASSAGRASNWVALPRPSQAQARCWKQANASQPRKVQGLLAHLDRKLSVMAQILTCLPTRGPLSLPQRIYSCTVPYRGKLCTFLRRPQPRPCLLLVYSPSGAARYTRRRGRAAAGRKHSTPPSSP